MSKTHSSVCYIFKEGSFRPVEKAKPFPNQLGLDLFSDQNAIYEGKTGLRLCPLSDAGQIGQRIESNGGMERLNQLIEDSLAKSGLSPRYTRPNETKKEVFPQKEKNDDIVLAKSLSGKKHFYYRFHNENGVELYTRYNQKDMFQTVYVPCEGFMIGIDQNRQVDEILAWLSTLENGIKGEIEKEFNESMENAGKWADLGCAAVLGREDEAREHNAPIREACRQQSKQEEASRVEREGARQTQMAESRRQAILKAEQDILNGRPVENTEVGGKPLILQLFREHNISVPLRTQGWIIGSLRSIQYDTEKQTWSYRHIHNDSTVIGTLLSRLLEAVQTKQQYHEQVWEGSRQGCDTFEPGEEMER